jgi:thiamine-phosphate pyrophosphorylase
MRMSRDLHECRLYAILDLAYVADEKATDVLRQLLEAGADIVQLRGKGCTVDELMMLAAKMLPLTTEAIVPLIANDHAEIAKRVEVQGVHVGQDDEAIAAVRAKVARRIVVGKSTHSIEQAIAAEREGADYIGFGPIYATPTKPDYEPIGLQNIREVHRRLTIPIFCIGGIKLENLDEILDAGAQRVVIVSGLLQASDPAVYARAVKAKIFNLKSEIGNSQ